MMRVRPLTLLLMLALTPLPLAAQEAEMVGDRPDFTESALSVPAGRIQLEAGLTFSDFESEGEQIAFGEALLRIGLAESFELRGGLGSWVDIDTGGAR